MTDLKLYRYNQFCLEEIREGCTEPAKGYPGQKKDDVHEIASRGNEIFRFGHEINSCSAKSDMHGSLRSANSAKGHAENISCARDAIS